MKLILVRHGETEWNIKHLVQGGADVPLNRKGREQAKKVSLLLKKEPIDVIYCSPSKRTRQTAAEILKFHRVPVFYSSLIKERSFGKMEGMHRDEYRKIRESSGVPAYLYRPPGGENYADVQKRVKRFLSLIKRKHKKHTVVVVSHGGVIRTIVTTLEKKPLERVYDIEYHNASVSVIELDGKTLKIHYLNSTEHL
ncbi:MAG: histidine phosphatase family protein [Candidatus Aenigmatarchaeota archaeon]